MTGQRRAHVDVLRRPLPECRLSGTTGYGLNVGTTIGGADPGHIGSSVRHQHDVTLPPAEQDYVRSGQSSTARPLFNDFTYTEFTQSIRDHQPSAGQHADLGSTTSPGTQALLERRVTAQRRHIAWRRNLVTSVSVWHQRDRESAHQRTTIYVRLWRSSTARPTFTTTTATPSSRNLHPRITTQRGRHVDSASTTFTWNAACWNDGLRPQRRHIARRRQSGQHLSSVRHQLT